MDDDYTWQRLKQAHEELKLKYKCGDDNPKRLQELCTSLYPVLYCSQDQLGQWEELALTNQYSIE